MNDEIGPELLRRILMELPDEVLGRVVRKMIRTEPMGFDLAATVREAVVDPEGKPAGFVFQRNPEVRYNPRGLPLCPHHSSSPNLMTYQDEMRDEGFSQELWRTATCTICGWVCPERVG